ncbi:MAG: hypothetical protein CMN30_07730 [Sandaracinus sp.]|nr:hypothetical protein [Sandaracinus sp.]
MVQEMARVCSAGAVWCAWLLGCTIALTAVPAHADENAAREAFLEGARHYEAGEYERAADAFERSYVERPVAVVLFNLAQALRFAGRPGEALRTFRQYLSDEADPGAARRAAVLAAIAELETETGELRIAVEGGAAFRVEVDGRVLTRLDVTQPFPLGVGDHQVTVHAAASEPTTQSVHIVAGQTARMRVALAAAGPRVWVGTDPTGARVWVDGEERGRSPVEVELEAGAHDLEVTFPGRASIARSLDLEAGEQLRLELTLGPEERLRDQWWLWAAVGGVALGALAVILAVTLPPDDPAPLDGTLPTVQALHWGSF